MQEAPAEGVATENAAQATYQRLQQQAAALNLSPAALQALLAESLAQQQALLRDNQQLSAARQELAACATRLPVAEAVAGGGSYELNPTTEALQATLNSMLYMVRAFEAVRDATGRIVDSIWVFANKA